MKLCTAFKNHESRNLLDPESLVALEEAVQCPVPFCPTGWQITG
jgi:hypothetical protein